MPRGIRLTSVRSPRSTYITNLRLKATRYVKRDKTYAKRPLTAKGRERNSNDYAKGSLGREGVWRCRSRTAIMYSTE